MKGVSEGEGVGTGFELGLHRTEEVPCIFIRTVLRILINPQDLAINIKDDVLMVLILITGRIPGATAIGVALHDPAQQLNLSSDGEVEGIGVGGGLMITADGIIIGADGF